MISKMSLHERRFTELEKVDQITGPMSAVEPRGRLLALDLGAKRIGVAVCDELRITTRPLPMIERKSWKDLLVKVKALVKSFDASGLVIGLPLHMDGKESDASSEVRALGEKFQQSLDVPIYFQDERLTTRAANSHLESSARRHDEIDQVLDSEAAAIVLLDFISNQHQ